MQNFIIKHIIPRDLCKTSEGKALWEKYVVQLENIAMQWPGHFTKETASQAIPTDAYNNHCHFCLSKKNNNIILAYYIVLITHYEAELVWGATDNRLNNKRYYLGALIDEIENKVFSKSSDIRILTAKVATQYSKIDNNLLGGKVWNRTNNFYRQKGFKFLYELDNYWQDGDHAILIAKHKEGENYGYDSHKLYNLKKRIIEIKTDGNIEINLEIQNDIRTYLIEYQSQARKIYRPLRGAPAKINKIFEGFVGLVFVPSNQNFVTIFLSTTDRPRNLEQFKYKFEYEIGRSMLTRFICSKKLNDNTVIFYKNIYDSNSEISVHNYFKTFMPEQISEGGYSLFFHRFKPSEDGSYIAIYAITPAFKNVILQKRNWKYFASSFFPMVWSVYQCLNDIYKARYTDSLYLKKMINCINISEKLKNVIEKYDRIVKNENLHIIDATIAHDLRSSLRNAIIGPMKEIYEKQSIENNTKMFLKDNIENIERYCDTLSVLVRGFKDSEQPIGNKPNLVIDKENITKWLIEKYNHLGIQDFLSPDDITISIEGMQAIGLNISEDRLKTIFHIVILNAVDAYYKKYPSSFKKLLFRVTLKDASTKSEGLCSFNIWNNLTQFPQNVIETAGFRPYTLRLAKKRAGLGLYLVEFLLSLSSAKIYQNSRHLGINNTKKPIGAQITFILPTYMG